MGNFYIKNGYVYIDGDFYKRNLLILNGVISEIHEEFDNYLGLKVYDAREQKIVPGFIDIHTHGAVNVDVNSATAEDLEKVSKFFAKQGTTSWLSSILTDSKKQTLWSINEHNRYKEVERQGADLLGIHLEGPFLAREYKGAMAEHLLRSPEISLIEEYQEVAKGSIKYITISPELDGILDIIKKLREMGIVVSIGHSGADYETTMKSIEYGAESATHIFNAMKPIDHHAPSIVGAALESDIYCEMICDGRHLHPGIVRLLIKTKGLNRLIAVTDSISACGLPDGKYKLGVNDVVVTNGDARLLYGGNRAGSTLTSINALKNIINFTNKPLKEVITLFTENPARLLRIFDHRGSIDIGKYADLVVLSKNYDVMDTFVKGKHMYSNSTLV